MNFAGLGGSPLDELCGSSNQEAQMGDTEFQVNNGDTMKWLSRGHNVASEKIDGLVFTMKAAKDYAQDLAARYGELEKSSRHICTSLTKLESVLNTDSSGKLGQPAKLLEPQRHEDSATCKGIHTSLANQTHNKIPDRNVKPSNDPNDISDENDKTKLFPLNDLMDSVKDVATPSDELKKSSRFIFNSLVKLESAHNTHTSRKFWQRDRLFWQQNDLKSVTCKGIQKSTPIRTHDQIPNKRAKLSIEPNDFSNEDDKANLFTNDSKGIIKPLNDYLHSNSMEMMNTEDYSNKIEICTSNYKRVKQSTVVLMGPGSNFHSVPRLTDVCVEKFPTPLAMYRTMKIPKLQSHTKLSYKDGYRGHYVTTKEDPALNRKQLSMFIRSKFPPSPEMQLTPAEIKVCAYMFNPENHLREDVVLRIGNKIATTRDIQCLCPDREIEDKIINIMALKTTLMQLHPITDQTVWSLPSSFADDVLQGQPVNQLTKTYAIHLMPPFSCLKYIYLPIKDAGHWYLVVVSLEERIVHHLDSCLHVGQVRQRHDFIRTMCSVLARMTSSEYFPHEYLSSIHKIRWWEIVDTKGISNCEQSDVNSAVWVLEWMKMEHFFQSNLPGLINEKVVRMRTAMDLLLCSHNEFRERVEARAEFFWNKH